MTRNCAPRCESMLAHLLSPTHTAAACHCRRGAIAAGVGRGGDDRRRQDEERSWQLLLTHQTLLRTANTQLMTVPACSCHMHLVVVPPEAQQC